MPSFLENFATGFLGSANDYMLAKREAQSKADELRLQQAQEFELWSKKDQGARDRDRELRKTRAEALKLAQTNSPESLDPALLESFAPSELKDIYAIDVSLGGDDEMEQAISQLSIDVQTAIRAVPKESRASVLSTVIKSKAKDNKKTDEGKLSDIEKIDYRSAKKKIESVEEELKNARPLIGRMDTIEVYLSKVDPGVFQDAETQMARVLTSIGAFEDEAAAGRSLEIFTSTARMESQQYLKGAVSNAENEVLAKTIPQPSDTPQVWRDFIAAKRAWNHRERMYADFLQKYVREYKNLDGADIAWEGIVATLPLIQDTKKGVVVNYDNLKKYQEAIDEVVVNPDKYRDKYFKFEDKAGNKKPVSDDIESKLNEAQQKTVDTKREMEASGLTIGTTKNGYEYIGGDVRNPESWVKVEE